MLGARHVHQERKGVLGTAHVCSTLRQLNQARANGSLLCSARENLSLPEFLDFMFCWDHHNSFGTQKVFTLMIPSHSE